MGATRPWDTIRLALRVLAAQLRESPSSKTTTPDSTDGTTKGPINVWFTGHSLGCSLASLAYARAISFPDELGPNVIVRDAYLFAAPVTTGRQAALAFNKQMNEERGQRLKTMWRVTNVNWLFCYVLLGFSVLMISCYRGKMLLRHCECFPLPFCEVKQR